MLQVRTQKHTSCRKKNSKHARFDQSRKQIRLIERQALQNLIKTHQPIKPIKWLEFQIYFT